MPVSPGGAAPVTSVFGRTGAVSLLSADVTTALGFTPANQAGDTFTGQVVAGHPGGGSANDQRYGFLISPASTVANFRPLGYKRQSDGSIPFYVDVAGGVTCAGVSTAELTVSSYANYNGTLASGFYSYQRFGGWDAYGADTGGTRLVVGGFRASQWAAVDLYTNGTRKVALGADGALQLERASSVQQRAAVILDATLPVSTDASRTGRGTLSAVDYAATRECIRWEADGSAARLGFYGGSAVAKPTVTGAHGANAALQSLLTALANLGLITDSSS